MKLPALLLAVLAPVGLAVTLELRVEPDQNNVTAGRLLGRWESDPLVAERMGLEADEEALEFAPSDDFLSRISGKVAEHLSELRIYERGIVTLRRGGRVASSSPYLLITLSGNPHLLMFRERDGDPLGDIESANVFVAPGKKREHDLLLMGGDFDNEPFRAFRRVKDDE